MERGRMSSIHCFRCVGITRIYRKKLLICGAVNNENSATRGKNHYQILGLKYNASPHEIKTAFRQLAHKYHPDVNKAPDAEEVFKCVLVAYEVLSDDKRRKEYNETLHPKAYSHEMDFASYRSTQSGSRDYTYYNQTKYNRNVYKRRSGRRSSKFEPTWVRRIRTNQEDDLDFDSLYSKSSHIDIITEWERSKHMMFPLTWGLAVVWQFMGFKSALAALGLALCFRSNLSMGYKLALAGTWFIGGFKGGLLAGLVLFSSSCCGVAYDAAVFTVVLGVWLRGSVLGGFVPLPPPVLLVMAYKLIGIQQ